MMTFYTYRQNIKPIFFSISLVMVVMLSLFTAKALKIIGPRQFTSSNGIINSHDCFHISWKLASIFINSTPTCRFAYFALHIISSVIFAFFTLIITASRFKTNSFALFGLTILLAIFQMAIFTLIFVATFVIKTFVEFRKRFCFFANTAGFCYDELSHLRFLSKRNRLESFVRPVRIFDSFYYSKQIA